MDQIDICTLLDVEHVSTTKHVIVLRALDDGATAEDETALDFDLDGFRTITRYEGTDTNASCSTRHILYQTAWNNCQRSMEEIVANLHKDAIRDIVELIRTSGYTHRASVSSYASGIAIPTALLVGSTQILNASVSQHLGSLKMVYEDSEDSQPEFLTVKVSNRDCASLSGACRKIVSGLIGNVPEDSFPGTQRISRLAPEDMRNLVIWYKTKFGDIEDGPKLVVVAEDFEAFNPEVAEDVFHILSRYALQIPLFLILSLSTSPESLYSVLPKSALGIFASPHFRFTLGLMLLRDCAGIFVNDLAAFDISTSVLQYLLSSYQELNQSLDSLISKIQYMHMVFFYRNPLSVLSMHTLGNPEPLFLDFGTSQAVALARQLRATASWKNALHSHMTEFEQPTEDLESEESALADILALDLLDHKSFDSYLPSEKNPDPTSSLVLRAGTYSESYMLQLASNRYSQRRGLLRRKQVALALVSLFGEAWPEKEKTGEWLLEQMWNGGLKEFAKKELSSIVAKSSDERFSAFLQLVSSRFSADAIAEGEDPLLDELRLYNEEVKDIVENGRRGAGRAHLVNSNVPRAPGTTMTEADKRFSQLVSRVAELLADIFEIAFGAGHELLLREAWTFDDVEILEAAFNPTYAAMQKDTLLEPSAYLSRFDPALANDDDEDANAVPPDMCEAFRLYRDTGKLVNLYDWFNAFDVVCDEREDEETPKKSTKANGKRKALTTNASPSKRPKTSALAESRTADDEEGAEGVKEVTKVQQMDARFLCAVGTLGFMGFVTATKRRPEHVLRAIW